MNANGFYPVMGIFVDIRDSSTLFAVEDKEKVSKIDIFQLVVKAGRKDASINSKVWIGKAVTRASNFSALGSKNGNPALVYSACSCNNFIDALEKRNDGKNPRDWFVYHKDEGNGAYYTASVVKSDFDK